MSEQKELLKTVDLFCKTIRKIGLKKVIRAMDTLYRQKTDDYDTNIIEFIIQKSCEDFGISDSDIHKNRVSGKSFVCRNIVIVLIHKYCNIDQIRISNLFNKKTHVTVSHAISDFRNKNEKIKDDRIYMEHYNRINDKVVIYKETLK